MFNFDLKKTAVYPALKISSFPLFAYAGLLSQAFLYAFIITLVLFGFSFIGLELSIDYMTTALVLLVCFLVCLELALFTEYYIKKQRPDLSLQEALGANGNLAEFLSLSVCAVVLHATKTAHKKKFSEVSSQMLLYALVVYGKEVPGLMVRLGLDPKKLAFDVKNYFEKQARTNERKAQPVFSESFEQAMVQASSLAVKHGSETIGEKELFLALTKHDLCWKEMMVSYDLKEHDIENITLWLAAKESRAEHLAKFWTMENLSRMGSLGQSFSAGFTVTLDQFSVDWSRYVANHIFYEIIGHQQETKEVETILAKSNMSNALIVGEEGIGRKSIVQGIAQRCYLNTSLPELNGKRVIELDVIGLLAKTQDQEQLEAKLDQIFSEVANAGNVILLIDDLEHFVGEKTEKLGMKDISGILIKYLAKPNFQFIGIMSAEGMHAMHEQNPAFMEYFRTVEVAEPSEIETIRILQNLTMEIEKKRGMMILYPSIREIVNLTSKYFPSTPFPKKAIDVLDEAVSHVKNLKEKVVQPHHIAEIISEKTHIPVGKMEFKEKSVLLNLETLIHQRIIAQEEAVHEISAAMRRARVGLEVKKRPMGSFLFLGPTGVGKTETAEVLAEIYFGGESKIIRLDMSEFQAVGDIPRLIGAVSPVELQGLLTSSVREKPFSLVLLDEIEKAHPDILNLMLQILDEGHITDGHGRKVMFTNTIIICTSNAGAKEVFAALEAGKPIEKDALLTSLFTQGTFKPEFVNRFDGTVIFHPLSREHLLQITGLMLSDLEKSLKQKDIKFIASDALKEKVVDLAYKPEFGAREIRRVLQDKVQNSIAEALLAEKIKKGDAIELNPENFEVVRIER